MFAIRSRPAARALEEGRLDSPVTRALGAIWARHAVRGLVRPARVPAHVAVVCVGGSTLGGSGKTRVAIACARALDEAGARVALIGHAYRSRRTMPCVVRIGPYDIPDRRMLEDFGDEAIVCARAVARPPSRACVVVGPSRQAAIDHAMLLSPDVLVLDGPLRIAPKTDVSLLAVDAERPWGSGQVVPAGDLRADRRALVACADHVVPVDATPSGVRFRDGRRAPVAELRELRVGLFTAIARPDRLVRSLTMAGVEPRVVVSVADHGPFGPLEKRALRRLRGAQRDVDLWVASEKCALHLLVAPGAFPLELGILESEVVLPGVSFRAVHAALRRMRTDEHAH